MRTNVSLKVSFLLCIWIISQMFVYKYFGINIRVDRILYLIIIVYFIYLIFTKKILKTEIGFIEKWMVIYTLICLMSYLFSNPEISFGENRYRWLLTIINMTFYPFVGYYVSKTTMNSYDARVLVIKTLVFMSLYLGLTGILEHYKLFTYVWPSYIGDPSIGTQFGRARGPFVESSTMGRILGLTTLTTIYYMYNSNGFRKIFSIIIILVSVISIYFSYTRGAWIAFALGIVVISVFDKLFRKGVIFVGIFIVILYFSGVAEKFSYYEDSLFSRRKNTIEYRYINYDLSLVMIKENPIFGIGYGKFNKEWFNYLSKTKNNEFEGFDGNHNTFLGIFAELGMLGFFSYILILLGIFKKLVVNIKNVHQDILRKQFSILTMGMLFCYLLAAQFVDYRFQSLQNTLLFIFAGIAASKNERKKSYDQTS